MSFPIKVLNRMAQQVFQYRYWDFNIGEFVYPDRMATGDYIRSTKICEIVGEGRIVGPDEVDDEGRFIG